MANDLQEVPSDAEGSSTELLIAQLALELVTISPIRGKLLHLFPLSPPL